MQTGERALDTSAVYQVILEEMELVKLEKILLSFKAKTNQEDIYFEVDRDVEVRFL